MSTPVTNPMRQGEEAAQHPVARTRATRPPLPDDGTRQLLQGAFWTLLVGILAAAATRFLFGGIGIHGPHTNSGWLSLIVAMMCLPFGCMLLALGGAKYLRNRRLARKNR
jgi:uncharacterized membrane protein YeaQ/YmgE (transglycosylase-associated protein family)